MLTEYQRRWGVDQWGAFLATRELPSMPRSKALLLSLEKERGEELSAKDLADIASGDPFLCLRLLREAERRRFAHKLAHETTTPLAAVMQLGLANFRRLLVDSPETDEGNSGLVACEGRAALATQLSLLWSSARSDIAPDEVSMATLLADTGELLLWVFAPELPAAAAAVLANGEASRSQEAQHIACGFGFHDLTVKCAQIWGLPPLLTQLIRGHDNIRANLSRLCIDTARHLWAGSDNPALAADLAEAQRLIPHASLEWLAARMVRLDADQQARVVERARTLLVAE